MVRFDKAIYLCFLLKFVLSVRLSNSPWGSDVLLFSGFINIVSTFVLYPYWVHYIVTHYLVISFAQYKEYMICLISLSKFSDVLPTFICAKTIGNLWSICLGVNIFNPFPYLDFIGNIPLLRRLWVNSLPS